MWYLRRELRCELRGDLQRDLRCELWRDVWRKLWCELWGELQCELRRKLWRDLSGQTGVRNLLGQFSGGHSNLMMRSDEGSAGLVRGLVVNAGLFAVLWWAGVGELYLVWVAGYLIFYPAIARIRQLAEHGAVINLFDPDPRAHTRSIQASWWERLLLCPNRVNYHLEHHFLASVPCYRLPALHGHLRSAGFYEGYDAALASGYRAVLKGAVQAAS